MKTAIVYWSTHHGNTKQLVEAIAAEREVTLIDGTADAAPDLSGYDRIGFAAGIAYGKFYAPLLALMEKCLPEGKEVFFLYTCGSLRSGYTKAAAEIADRKHADVIGEYGCLGFDTFGPFRLIGGIAKGHPDAEELAGAVAFYNGITQDR